MTVGEAIKDIRTKKGITQVQLATAIGMDDAAIRKYESGKLKPKAETIEKIARALNVEPATISCGGITAKSAMIQLFSIFKNYRGEMYQKGDAVYIELKALEPFLQTWCFVYKEMLSKIDEAQSISDDDEREEVIKQAKLKYEMWLYSYPEGEPQKEMLELMSSWDTMQDSDIEGMVLDKVFEKEKEQ